MSLFQKNNKNYNFAFIRQKNLKVGIQSYSENLTSLEVVGNSSITGIVTASNLFISEISTLSTVNADNLTLTNDLSIGRDVNVNRNLHVDGNITVGGTTAIIYVQEFIVTEYLSP